MDDLGSFCSVFLGIVKNKEGKPVYAYVSDELDDLISRTDAVLTDLGLDEDVSGYLSDRLYEHFYYLDEGTSLEPRVDKFVETVDPFVVVVYAVVYPCRDLEW